MFLSEWREFISAPCLAGKKKLDDSSGLMLLKSRASLTCFRACFLPGRAKDLSAPRYVPTCQNCMQPEILLGGGGVTAPSGPRPPHSRGFWITHNDAPQSVGLLWTSDQIMAETSTWQHTTLATDRHPCLRWDSNSQSQQASGPKPNT